VDCGDVQASFPGGIAEAFKKSKDSKPERKTYETDAMATT
jgi:hypothetical protein